MARKKISFCGGVRFPKTSLAHRASGIVPEFGHHPIGRGGETKAIVLVRIDSQPHAMKISLIGVHLSFRGQFDEICPHSVSDLGTL